MVAPSDVIAGAAEAFGIPVEAIRSPGTRRGRGEIERIRRVVSIAMRTGTTASYPEIARAIGDKCHSASFGRVIKGTDDATAVELILTLARKRQRIRTGQGVDVWAAPPRPAWAVVASSRRLAGCRAESAA